MLRETTPAHASSGGVTVRSELGTTIGNFIKTKIDSVMNSK